ncbi:actin depolymerizing factor [Fusarium flagelliforme]|uniref:actin depolymerizing factor n=1 Tax=Fusarium flagelliforme TaxID=2675880 RepID=UPI001E8CAC99|nr:actin depolymerizing factor [Fusarium flagelliforme]KAH7198946.1 actin depolymerizing factor [Fusarium flagelliforme]
MSSGVIVNSACLETYQELKLKKNHKFIILKLSKDYTQIIVDQTSESSDWEDFMKRLPEDEPRWAVYDLTYERPEGGAGGKLILLSWSPDVAHAKAKMVFASSRSALRRSLVGIDAEIQVNEYSEIAYEEVLGKVSSRF